MKTLVKRAAVSAILATSLLLGGCDNVAVYGSVGYSSYSGYGGYGGYGYGSSVRIGGRIY
ncbi:MAG: hypothetical protein P8Y61_13670 [Gammaproteobacteria bacterium]|jgi:hypothetical protein